jgi:hypothetical protein
LKTGDPRCSEKKAYKQKAEGEPEDKWRRIADLQMKNTMEMKQEQTSHYYLTSKRCGRSRRKKRRNQGRHASEGKEE